MTQLARARRLLVHATAEEKRFAATGRRAMAVVLRMKRQIEKAFYVMGRALAALDEPRVFRALGYESFDALCEVGLGVAPAQADRLVHIVNSFTAAEAKRLTRTKATAIIDLARAMGGRATARGLLARGTVHVGNKTIDVTSATATKIDRVAAELRAGKHTSGPGVHVAPEDAKAVAAIARELRAQKLDATIEAIAADAARGAKMRLVARVRDRRKLARALDG